MRHSKVIAKVLAAGLALGVCGMADAKANTTTSKPVGVHGVIVSVQRGLSQITVKIGSAKKGTLSTARIVLTNTVIELKNKAAGAFSDLHAGDRIIIEPDATNPTIIIDEGGGHRHARPVK